MAAKNNASEIRIVRLYDAPVQAVWDAWTDPAQTAQWWGPRGFTITTHSKDLRPRGSWSYTMHGPDGVDYPNKTVYHEVEPRAKLVYDHGSNDDRPPLFRVAVLFSEVNRKTRMEMSMTLPTPEAAEQTRKFIKAAGGDATWDRLAEYLEKESSGKENFVIARSFDAPIEVMFEMWTNPAHLSQWLPPTGFRMEFIMAEVKTGGSTLYFMGNETIGFHGRSEYLKIERPGRIIYKQQFCDENGNISRHPMAPTWPDTMLTTVELTEEGADRTRVTVKAEPYGATTREELDAFIEAKGGMTQGWSGSFDQLDAYLSRS
ncbi:MAG: hypothetical protein JWR25_1789 [Noviherbaspirillum sp.]|nr:hypothetical protein [Noviherbaspirillum sp.]